MKRTKIIATIGPASEKEKTLRQMVEEGMDVTRLNFSHGDFLWHKKIIERVKNIRKKTGKPIGIMVDLQGPRIRVANGSDVSVVKDEMVLIESTGKPKKKAGRKIILIDHKEIVRLIKIGNEILIEDGLIKLKVISKNSSAAECRVINGGTIKPRKGINIPGISAKMGALTLEDKKVLEFTLPLGIDFVAMSFVRNSKEIEDLRNLLKKISGKKANTPQIIAKIERREAVRNFDNILKASDSIMVARGDLGIEMPQEDIPILQKEMIAKTLKSAKPVIVATQMLDSMIRNPRPTRAEVTDVSNAVIDHTDAVMLSGETASGKYPVEAIRTMRKIIERTEMSPFDDLEHGFLADKAGSVSAAIAETTHELAKDSNAKAIVVASLSGFTARMIARHRPEQKIYVMTNNSLTQNQLSLVWGAESFVLPNCKDLDELIDKSVEVLKKNKLLKKKERMVIVTGRPHVKKEHMSLVKVEEMM
jgi:pyruvate kinase